MELKMPRLKKAPHGEKCFMLDIDLASIPSQCEDSELPYYEFVTADPTEDEMRAVVCLKVRLRLDSCFSWIRSVRVVVNSLCLIFSHFTSVPQLNDCLGK